MFITSLLTCFAQSPDADVQLFQLTGADRTWWTEDAGLQRSGTGSFQVVYEHVNRPLVVIEADGTSTAVVRDINSVSFRGDLQLWRATAGITIPALMVDGDAMGFGELVGDLKLGVVDSNTSPVGLAFVGRLGLPTASIDAPVESTGTTWEAALVTTANLGKAQLTANLGTRGVPQTDLDAFVWDDHATARASFAYGNPDIAGFSVEGAVHMLYTTLEPGAVPAEAMVGGWARLTDQVVFQVGGGTGVNAGFGAPRARALAGIAFRPRVQRERTVEIASTAAVTVPATPAPQPEPVELPAEAVTEAVAVAVAEPAVTDAAIEQALAEIVVPDPEPAPVFIAPAPVTLEGDRLVHRLPVTFSTGTDFDDTRVLDDIASFLVAHPEISHVRIEAHTDNRGSGFANLELSRERAGAVARYLVGQGVSASRLESHGFGESHPLVLAEGEAAWAQNRRVDFVVVATTN